MSRLNSMNRLQASFLPSEQMRYMITRIGWATNQGLVSSALDITLVE